MSAVFDHEVHRQGRDVGGADDAPDRQRRPQLLAARLEVVAEQRRRQRRVDEPGCDQVDPDRRHLEREVRDERRERRRGRADRAEADAGAAPAGPAHEEQRAAGPDALARVAGDAHREPEMLVGRALRRFDVELGQRRVVRPAGGDHDVVDGRRQRVEERRQRVGIRGVEGRRARARRSRPRRLEAPGVARREHDLGALGASEPRGLEPDARAAADDHDGLAGERGPAGAHDVTASTGRPDAIAAPSALSAPT